MSGEHEIRRDHEPSDVDPEDFLRALMKISPEDAKKAREQSPATRPRSTTGNSKNRTDCDE